MFNVITLVLPAFDQLIACVSYNYTFYSGLWTLELDNFSSNVHVLVNIVFSECDCKTIKQ